MVKACAFLMVNGLVQVSWERKLFLSLVAAIVAASATFAQSSLVATLSHEGAIQIFHGQTAYKQAMEAAAHGDIITLSSGRFTATNITKAVTIRGAGYEADLTQRTFPTIITGNFDINIETDAPAALTIEGIYHGSQIRVYNNLKDATLMKSNFNEINMSSSETQMISDLKVINCQINKGIGFGRNSSASFINSFVKQPTNDTNNSNLEFTNCVIVGTSGGYIRTNTHCYDLYNSVFYNDIIYSLSETTDRGFVLSETNNVYDCIGYQGPALKYDIFHLITNASNTNVPDITSIFKGDTFYELTDEAKAAYLGADGTEVGIYGGDLPYSSKVLSPQITKCQVAKKTTADGKLSVDIEVKAAE